MNKTGKEKSSDEVGVVARRELKVVKAQANGLVNQQLVGNEAWKVYLQEIVVTCVEYRGLASCVTPRERMDSRKAMRLHVEELQKSIGQVLTGD